MGKMLMLICFYKWQKKQMEHFQNKRNICF